MNTVLAASGQSLVLAAGVLLLVGSLVLVVTRRFGVALALYVVYIGTIDGYVKLATGSEAIAVGRTVLLGVIVGASLLALLTDRRNVSLPRGSILIAAFVLVALVQIANPGNPNFIKPIGSLRQEIEFVPLFFLAYATVRREADVQNLLLLLVAVAVANGIANLIQYNLSPEQFAGWGPGYRDRIFGTSGGVTGRTFDDGSVSGRARPFGLGADAGSGGVAGLLGAGAVVALILRPRVTSFGSATAIRAIAVAAVPFVLLAVVLSLTRAVIVATVLALVVQALLSARRQLIPLIVVGALAFAVGGIIIQQATSGSSAGEGLARYDSISPGQLLDATRDSRGSSLAIFPTYVAKYPFGAGLGGVGPSTGFQGSARPEEKLNGETQFNVTVLDLGVPGLVLLAAFIALTLRRVLRLKRLPDATTRVQLVALAGPFVGIVALFFSASPLTGVPAGPYFWATAGILCYWVGAYEKPPRALRDTAARGHVAPDSRSVAPRQNAPPHPSPGVAVRSSRAR